MSKDKPKIKIIDTEDLPSEIKNTIDDIIKNIRIKQEQEQEQEQESLECEKHIEHYERYIGICFDKDNEKIGVLHSNDNKKFESFMKDCGNVDDGYIRKIIVYEAKEAVVDTTKYSKGKKKKPKKVVTIQAPKE